MTFTYKKLIVVLIILLSFFLVLTSNNVSTAPQQFWVSPTGSDSTGNGSSTNPWLHINYAIQQIGSDTIGVAQRILNVLPGTYAPSTTGEVFPITMVNNLWLNGTDSSNTVLDAELTSHVISCWQTKDVKISDFTVQKGLIGLESNIGGITCKDGALVEIYNCIVQYCKGGGIFSANNSPQHADSVTFVYIHNSMIRHNYYFGNGIKVTGGDLKCEYNIIDNNNSDNGTGSAIATIGGAFRRPTAEICNNIIKRGRSNGGAIQISFGNYLVTNNLFIKNTTAGLFNDGGGGGIFVSPAYGDTCIIKENLIVGNTSQTIGGGISVNIYNPLPEMHFRIQDNIITYNTALGKGGAIGFHNGSYIIVGGEPGKGNDIFNNIGQDSINLFYHDSPGSELSMNFQYNYLGEDTTNFVLYSDPDSLFDISNYRDTMGICGVTYNCDSLFYALGLITGLENSYHEEISKTFKLKNNYPNPFNNSTYIEYELFKSLDVKLTIYSLLGKQANTLVHEWQPQGNYRIKWDGKNQNGKEVSSGIYFYMLQADKHRYVGSMLLVK